MTEKSMMLHTGAVVSADNGYVETFKMIPTTMDCPYIEAMYVPGEQILFIRNKEKKFNLVEEKGPDKGKLVEMHYEYTLNSHNEILKFVNRFASNADEFDYLRYMNN
jgi:hypothetical protein